MAPSPPAGFDTSGVSGPDAVVTLRSFRRRFAEAFDQADSDDDVTRRPSEGGPSPVELAATTATALETIGAAVNQVLVAEDPEIELPPVDPEPPGPVTGSNESPAAALARLGESARSVSDALAAVHGNDWARAGRAGDGPVSLLDIARLAVRIGVQNLRAAQEAIRSHEE